MTTAAAPDGDIPNQPYREVTDDDFAVHAAKFDVEETPDRTVVLRGTCPRCTHVMEYMISTTVVTKGWRWRRAASPPPPATATPAPPDAGSASPAQASAHSARAVEKMCCTCEEGHPGRPAGYLGCGAYWDLIVEAT